MSALGVGRRLRAALDPVLVPLGFQAGQGGDDAGQVIWCGGHDELSEAYPGLPQAFQQPPGTCIDLVVEVGDDGTLERLDLEAPDLVATLRQVGREPTQMPSPRCSGGPSTTGSRSSSER